MSGKHGAGKGDRYRQVDQDKYRENYEKIFGEKTGQRKKKKYNGKRKGDSNGSKDRKDS